MLGFYFKKGGFQIIQFNLPIYTINQHRKTPHRRALMRRKRMTPKSKSKILMRRTEL